MCSLPISRSLFLGMLALSACREEAAMPETPPAETSSAEARLASAPAAASPNTIIGTDNPDQLSGSAGDDDLDGLGGDDVLIGGGGNDSLSGGDGNDLLIGDGDSTSASTGSAVGDGPFLVVDQFGYRPEMAKVAILRDPVVGHDSDDALVPDAVYEVVELDGGTVVQTLVPTPWQNGATDSASGDRVWWLDFSSLNTPGTYFIRDRAGAVSSSPFDIRSDVYADVLKAAVRTFFYQRAGFAKEAPFAEDGWTDGASHLGPGQDGEARRFDAPNDASTAKDLRGGWYDAGDFNKYTNWTADYITSLLLTYLERPAPFTDDYGIPESGNGVPDLLDEVKYGLDWLVRMQNTDGSMLSILGLDSASPPSAASGASAYGNANTSATLTSAGAFALASTVYRTLGDPALTTYADDLEARAELAWAWADANPAVEFRNNDAASGTEGLGAGQQEVDATARAQKKLSAAIHLANATGKSVYQDYVTANYTSSELVGSFFIDGFRRIPQRDLLFYTEIAGANATAVSTIRSRYENAMETTNHWGSIDAQTDPYRAHLPAYTWGSNRTKSSRGTLFLQSKAYNLGTRSDTEVDNAAAGFVHYIHGVNPQGLVYLSNMGKHGAERSVDTFYHAWFADGSPDWDSVKTSTYGPAPGFLVGGPNPSYTWDGCCPNGCFSPENNARCGTEVLSPPAGQPDAKAYREFNDSWPVNSWQITENHNDYQVEYIRLLAHFVD